MDTQHISKGLDYYKVTMGQVEFEKHPEAIVTFELKNRSDEKLSDYVAPEQLRQRLARLEAGWTPEEVAYLASLQAQDGTARFSEEYLDHLLNHELPPVDIGLDNDGELRVRTTGAWTMVTFWETIIMSQLNELYFENKLASEGLHLDDLYAEGDRRLDAKIEVLKNRPDIRFADFGTRRRFSYSWQKHVVERLAAEVPNNLLGTSNIWLAYELNLAPIGTYAHEMPMVYAAMADAQGRNPLDGHGEMLRDWEDVYDHELSIALTDTFGSEYFFTTFSGDQVLQWDGLRHDSGDPFEFGERVIQFYEDYGIDPTIKTIVFSDGLDMDMIVRLADHFAGRVGHVFGWGTTLTNDLGVRANNFVMKAVEVDGRPTVKLSDVNGKHTGPTGEVIRYQDLVSETMAKQAVGQMVMVR